MNVNRSVLLALVVSMSGVSALAACGNKKEEASPTTPAASGAVAVKDAAPAAQEPSANGDAKPEKEAKEKGDKDKGDKDKGDKEKVEELTEKAIKDLAVGEPVEGVIVVPDPPADVAEVSGPAPSGHHVWLPGHWRYDFPLREFIWQAGMWVDKIAYPTNPPDPERFEVVGKAPGHDWFWAPGYWRWDGHAYDWGYGHWLKKREGMEWVHPFYENINGHWESRGWGFERKDKEWTKHHEGWDHHGEFWAHPGYFKDREKYVKEHQAEVRDRIKEAKRREGEPEKPAEKHEPPVDKHEAEKRHGHH